ACVEHRYRLQPSERRDPEHVPGQLRRPRAVAWLAAIHDCRICVGTAAGGVLYAHRCVADSAESGDHGQRRYPASRGAVVQSDHWWTEDGTRLDRPELYASGFQGEYRG